MLLNRDIRLKKAILFLVWTTSGVIRFTIAAYLSLHIVACTVRQFAGKALHEIRQFQQVGDPQRCASVADHHLGIRAHEISPLRRNRPDRAIFGLQQKAFTLSVGASSNTRQLPRELRMKRVRDPN